MATHTREMIRTAASRIDRALEEQGVGPDGIAKT
jgi:hypothetical protein